MASKFAIETVFSAINRVSTTVKKMTADIGGLGVVAARAQSALGGIGRVGVTMGKGIGIAAAGASAAAFGIYKLTEGVSTLGDDVAKTARALGLSANALQEFRYIGERSGVGVDEMDIALKKLTVNIGDATSEVSKSLAKLGVSPRMLKAAGPDEALNMIADGMARVKDPAKRAAIAVDLFGKNGVKMVNVLGEGRAGMATLAKEAHRVGYVLDGDTLDASEKLNDMILNMRTSFKALGNQLASKFMPLVTDAVVGITGFLVDNREIFDGVAEGLVGVFQGIGPMAASLLPALASALVKVGGLLNKVFTAAGPLIQKLGTMLVGAVDRLLPVFSDLLEAAMPVLTQIMDSFIRIMPSVLRIAEAIGRVLVPAFKLLKPVLDLILPVIELIAKALGGLADLIAAVITPLVDGLTFIFEKLNGMAGEVAKSVQSGPTPGYAGMGFDSRIPGYTPASQAPVSSQTSTINRNTQNNLSVDINNRTPYGVSAKSTGPSAPPITINTGNMYRRDR